MHITSCGVHYANTKKIKKCETPDKIIFEENEKSYQFIKHRNTLLRIDTVSDGDYFRRLFPIRLGPFITGQGPKLISELIFKNVENGDTSCIK